MSFRVQEALKALSEAMEAAWTPGTQVIYFVKKPQKNPLLGVVLDVDLAGRRVKVDYQRFSASGSRGMWLKPENVLLTVPKKRTTSTGA